MTAYADLDSLERVRGWVDAAQPPMANKYPVCRLVLTPEAVVDLYNNLSQLMGILQRSGLINIDTGNPTVIAPKTIN